MIYFIVVSWTIVVFIVGFILGCALPKRCEMAQDVSESENKTGRLRLLKSTTQFD